MTLPERDVRSFSGLKFLKPEIAEPIPHDVSKRKGIPDRKKFDR
jgi:hypothetical protein